jgi:hypothetical protein
MAQSMPDAKILLEAAAKYLDEELAPTLSGYHRFQTRVTINALNIVRRELELREAQIPAERARLAALIGHDGEIETLERELIERMRAGAISSGDPALRAHIRESLAAALVINNPKWISR